MSGKQPLPPRLQSEQIPLATLERIVFGTSVARHVAITDTDSLPYLTAQRIWDNVQAWASSGDWPDRRRTAAEIDTEEVGSE